MSGFPQYERGAPYWVWVLLCLQTTLLTIATIGVGLFALGVVADGASPAALLVVLLYAAFPVLVGLLARAWRRQRVWSWWALVALSAVGGAYGLVQLLAGGGVGAVAALAVDALVLALLFRPAGRRWVRPEAEDRAPTPAR